LEYTISLGIEYIYIGYSRERWAFNRIWKATLQDSIIGRVGPRIFHLYVNYLFLPKGQLGILQIGGKVPEGLGLTN